ncbi:hypothetical protein NQZ68_018767, partial [Dissostichus eleginoides]
MENYRVTIVLQPSEMVIPGTVNIYESGHVLTGMQRENKVCEIKHTQRTAMTSNATSQGHERGTCDRESKQEL